MTLETIRSQFPFLNTGIVYLNHASTSPWSLYVDRAMKHYSDVCMYGEVENFHDILHTFHETRALAAEYFGTTPDRLAFVQNTSEGLNILASGLDWKSGDRILLVDKEFPANVYPFLNARQHGVEIDFVPQHNGRIDLNDIEAAIRPETRLLSISWVQYLSGFKIDIADLYALCSSKGVLLCVDGIQGVGAARLDLRKMPVDFLSCGVQKWQMGLHGLAVVYLTERMQSMIRQQHAGWFSVKNAFDFSGYNLDFANEARRYENGTYNTIAIFGYNGALKLFQEIGFDTVGELVRANTDYVFAQTRERGLPVLTPERSEERAGIVTFAVKDAEGLWEELRRRNVTVSARNGHIRVAPHCYNTREEVDALFGAIDELRGQFV